MAFTLQFLEGFETGGLERLSSSSGTVSTVASQRSGYHGDYCLQADFSSISSNRLILYEFQGTPNTNAKGIGISVRLGDGDGVLTFLTIRDSGQALKLRLGTLNGGHLRLIEGGGSQVHSAPNFFSDGQEHFIELWWQESSSADWYLQGDGLFIANGTGADFGTNPSFYLDIGALAGTTDTLDGHFDDIYFAECTSASDLLGDVDIFAPRGDGSATETGDTLDAGTLLNTQEIPGNDSNTASFSPPAPSSEQLAPDVLLVQTGLTGSVTDVDEDPDSPDANWLTTSNNTNTDARASFPTPTGTPDGTQTLRAWVRKTNHSTDPTAVVELWENGSGPLATVVTSTTISSTSGQMLSGTFNASLLGTADGSAVEIRVVGTVGGGNPSNRASVEVGALEWDALTAPADALEFRYRQADSGANAGPNGMSGIGTIIGSLIYTRARYTGSGSTLLSRTYWGESGGTEHIERTEAAVYADTFLERITSSVPEPTDYAVIGWGRPSGTDVTVEASELLHMIARVPPVATGKGVVYNPVRRMMPFLAR